VEILLNDNGFTLHGANEEVFMAFDDVIEVCGWRTPSLDDTP